MKIDIQNSLTLIFSPISIVLVDAGTSPSLPGLAIIQLAELFSLSCPFFIVLSFVTLPLSATVPFPIVLALPPFAEVTAISVFSDKEKSSTSARLCSGF